MKRIFLFLVTNIAVMVTLSVVASLLGINQYITAQGIDFGALLGFAAVFGFGGAFISLAISKWSAKMAVGAQVIEVPRNSAEYWLVDTVKRQAQAAGIGMPEVAIYDSPEVNAFATGMSRNNALVAVSTGLLERMTREEAEAVLGHEVSHVANGDMVTLTLIQGVLNTFVIFLSRAIGYFVDRVVLKNQEGPGHRLLPHPHRARDPLRHTRLDRGHVVLAPARVSRRRRRRTTGRPRQDDRRAAAAAVAAGGIAPAREGRCLRHQGRQTRLDGAVLHPPAAGRSHRGAARRRLNTASMKKPGMSRAFFVWSRTQAALATSSGSGSPCHIMS